jgi:hypothetical protein
MSEEEEWVKERAKRNKEEGKNLDERRKRTEVKK